MFKRTVDRRHIPAGGFTLLELLTSLAIGLVLLVAGVPGFSTYIANQRATASARELVQDLLVARTEAARSGLRTGLTPIDGSWSKGWSVTRDDSPFEDEAVQQVLETHAVPDQHTEVAVCAVDAGEVERIEFASMGELLEPNGGVRLVLASRAGSVESYREIVVLPNGRAETKRLTAAEAGSLCG